MGLNTPTFRDSGEGTQLNAIDIIPLKSQVGLSQIYNFDVYVDMNASNISAEKKQDILQANPDTENIMVRLENQRFIPDSLFLFNGEWYMAGTAYLYDGYEWDGRDYKLKNSVTTRAFVYLGEKDAYGNKPSEIRFKNYEHLSQNLGPQALYNKITENAVDANGRPIEGLLSLTYENIEFDVIVNGQVSETVTGRELFDTGKTVQNIIDMINSGNLIIKQTN
jgi:hypothetical protein